MNTYYQENIKQNDNKISDTNVPEKIETTACGELE